MYTQHYDEYKPIIFFGIIYRRPSMFVNLNTGYFDLSWQGFSFHCFQVCPFRRCKMTAHKSFLLYFVLPDDGSDDPKYVAEK
jgi:hypothetical protein